MITNLWHNRRLPLWISTALLLTMFTLAVHSMAQKSPTIDEQGFLVRGLAYVRGDNRQMRVGHPLGLNALNALFLWRDETVALPIDDPSWQTTDFHRPAELFMWEIGNDVEHTIFLGRLPTVYLGLLLAAVGSRWAYDIVRRHGTARHASWAGVIALALLAFDPNILAHMRLTTTDLGLVAAATLAAYALWRFLADFQWHNLVLAAVALGLLQNSKFTAALFVPLFLIAVALVMWRQRQRDGHWPVAQIAAFALVYPTVSLLTLWASYGFEIGTLPDVLPAWSDLLGGRTLPLAAYLEQLADLGGRIAKPTPAFLNGNYSDSGWWSYFPIAFALKTPLATLVLAVAALGVAVVSLRGERRFSTATLAMLLIPPVGYFLFAMSNAINIGYRHILIVVPFLAVAIAAVVGVHVFGRKQTRPLLPAISLAIIAVAAIAPVIVAPDYLAYFNRIAGGPENGWRHLVDSNIDWGQDLGALGRWMEAAGVNDVRLSYFGEGRPDYYGIEAVGLPSFPPRLMHPGRITHYPDQPAAGTYAISVTNLQGALFDDPTLFAAFRDLEPRAAIGHSILVYDIEPVGEPAQLILTNMQVTDIAPNDYANLGGNDVALSWLRSADSLVIPSQPTTLFAMPTVPNDALLRTLHDVSLTEISTNDAYTMYASTPDAVNHALLAARRWQSADFELKQGSGAVTLTRFFVAVADAEIRVYTWIEQDAAPQPLRQFVHLSDDAGAPVAQWDGMAIDWQSWQQGDALIQVHTISTAGVAPGDYQLVTGLYNPTTNVRWQTADADNIKLQSVTIRE